jgi:hypothetical protein
MFLKIKELLMLFSFKNKIGNIVQPGYFFILILILALIMNCATVGVNNYQTAETIGKNKVKFGGAVELGRQMDAGINVFRSEIDLVGDLEYGNYTLPILELDGQFGITKSTDIGLTLTTSYPPWSGSKAIYLKQNFYHTAENSAAAIMVKSGTFGSTTESGGDVFLHSDLEYERVYDYKGYFIDIPLILSKRWDFISLHFSPRYLYHHLTIETDYNEIRKNDGTVVYENSNDRSFKFNTVGMSAGISLMLPNIYIMPELSYLRVKNLAEDTYRWILFPGFGIFVKL